MFAAISSLAICGCRTIVKENNKTDNINRYFWIPSSSGTVQHPIEVFMCISATTDRRKEIHICFNTIISGIFSKTEVWHQAPTE